MQRRVLSPVLRLLRRGATPQRLAWSMAIGAAIGMNPLLGSSTVAMLLLASLLRLNQTASQIGVHTVYPLQLLLFLPFLRAGTLAFHTDSMPMKGREIFALGRSHPVTLVETLWTWEWHALIVWLGCAVVITPALALLLRRFLEHAMREQSEA